MYIYANHEANTNVVKRHNFPAFQVLPAPGKTFSLLTCGNLCTTPFSVIPYDLTTWICVPQL